jgi:serpin B
MNTYSAREWLRRLFGREEPAYDPLQAVARPRADGPLSFAEGNNRFALALYERLRQQPGNLFFSPFSIRSALGMALAGARDETATQMREALCAPPVDGLLHADIAQTVTRLEAGGGNGVVSVSNSLWAQAGAVLQPGFLDLIAQYYRGAVQVVDFRRDPDAARSAINMRVRGETRGRITGLIPPGTPDVLTRLLLVNAVYFKGSWASRFDESATEEEPFYPEVGETMRVPLMRQRTHLGYLHARGFDAVDLPYRGGALSLLVLLPDRKDGLRTLEETLSAAVLDDVAAHMHPREVDLFLPRFTTTWGSVDLCDPLAALGMPLAFDAAGADFSGINGLAPPAVHALHLSAVFHKAFVELNERGTEAAAATAPAMLVRAMARPSRPVPIPVFRADRPFLYAIRDRHSGALLFLGRMADPTSRG